MSTTQVEQVKRTQDGLRDQLGRIREEAARVENEARIEGQSWANGASPDPAMIQEWTSVRYQTEAFIQRQREQADSFATSLRERADRAMQSAYQSPGGSSSSTFRSVQLVRQVLDVCEQLVVAQASLLEAINPQYQQSGTK